MPVPLSEVFHELSGHGIIDKVSGVCCQSRYKEEKEEGFMQSFQYYTPTEVIFGKGTEQKAGELVKKYGGSRAAGRM